MLYNDAAFLKEHFINWERIVVKIHSASKSVILITQKGRKRKVVTRCAPTVQCPGKYLKIFISLYSINFFLCHYNGLRHVCLGVLNLGFFCWHLLD